MDNKESEELEAMNERDWPVYAVLMKHGDLYYHEPALGNRYGTGGGWLMVLPWAEELKRGGITHGDNRFGVESEDVAAFTLLDGRQCAEEARREWKPIDTAPKGGTPVLVCVGNYDERGDIGAHPNTARYETFPPNAPGKASWRCLHGHKLWPTHWMPMPEAPRAAESKEG